MLRALLIDLSGTLHVGSQATPGAALALTRLREAGIHLRFASNTSKESRGSLLLKMKDMGMDVREEELFTSLDAVRVLVERRGLRPLYILTESARSDFPPSSPPYDSVVVGLAPSKLNYSDLNEAFRLLSSGTGQTDIKLIATHKALYLRDSDGGLSLGPGPFVSALEEASGVTAEVVGKPTRRFFELALKSLESCGIISSDWGNVGIIGDDKTQDVGLVPGQLGLQRFLVKTGKYRPGDEDSFGKGDDVGSIPWVGENFSTVVDHILSS